MTAYLAYLCYFLRNAGKKQKTMLRPHYNKAHTWSIAARVWSRLASAPGENVLR